MKKLENLNLLRESGILMEINRQVLHPIGLALSIDCDDDGNVLGISGILDSRDDPEGWIYNTDDEEYAKSLCEKKQKYDKLVKKEARMKEFGWVVQPLCDNPDCDCGK
jgi:hypothetical protein